MKQQQAQLKQRPNSQNYQFATTSQEILRKYSKYPASLSLHIFETHYRFNNSQDSNVIPKNSPMIKSFFQHVLKEQIPIEMSELLKDFSIRSYDGCLILQVYDHRNIVATLNPTRASASGSSPAVDSKPKTEDSTSTSSPAPTINKPKTYRTLLRPTQLSIYYDLLYHTDSALTKFTDQLSLQMESEILTLTNRKLDLSVPLNPYLCADYLKPEEEYPKKVWNEEKQDYDLVHEHREAVENEPRKLRQDELVLHKSSEYEELMLLLSNKYKRSDEAKGKRLVVVGSSSLAAATSTAPTSSTSAKPLVKDGATGPDGKLKKGDKPATTAPQATSVQTQSTSRNTGQFMRLRLIEEIRKKREADKARQDAKIQEQANVINQSNTRPIVMQNDKKAMVNQSQQIQDPQIKQQHMPPQAPNQPPLKKQKPDGMGDLGNVPSHNMPMNNNMVGANIQNVPQQRASPAPRSQGQVPHQPQAQQQAQSSAQPLSSSGSANEKQPSLQQQQQQQIFQNSLTAEEQQHFRQLQSRMSAFAQMSSSGVAPTGQQLTPQQQQQALQQAKLIQQQLVQKFPVYFQRLRQFQLIQQQRQQKLLQLQQNQRKPLPGIGNNQNLAQLNQRPNVGGKTIPGSQQFSPDKRKAFKKK
ncbi:uncharacterized protein CANTADRAFT_56737 [Suhomyces tanzawaensis NRRL Y-17324]|uniref:Spt20-like SEP domain-containing protein n=1 Tax=Suhomyces tanzawaensis NRRL Y-17324 TaxID=984487 RepID=A0A1E4SBV1_9ASCO|nr:uncharacterized protein CANTADRAFT_56737 [Suhomyces tanzawaensis NRRL Y-17324]ODV76958.1 hypothetical protein CANTADRAFT_56737 [Suhomyces tanzawaensis NRRL Y-17324]